MTLRTDTAAVTTPTGSAGPGDAAALVIHGTAVDWLQRGVLLLGASGAGKSDLALRLIERGAVLVADDLVALAVEQGRLVARPHGTAGLIELRGQGIFRLASRPAVSLELCLELAGQRPDDGRLPAARVQHFLGLALPCHRLDPATGSATARVRTLLSAERVW